MRLREISVQTIPKHKFQKKFNRETWCVCEMYWRVLGELETSNIAKLTIILGENKPDQRFGNVLCSYQQFNFDIYFSLDELNRKRSILDIIHYKLTELCDRENIFKSKLNEAYVYCIDSNLKNKWLLKNKFKRSPDHRYFGGIECDWRIDRFYATGVILNKNRIEIYRKDLFVTEAYMGDFIYWTNYGWTAKTFYLKSKDGKIWEIDCSELN